MKNILFDSVVDAVEKLVMETNYNLPHDVLDALMRARKKETKLLAASIFDQIIENADIASSELSPFLYPLLVPS